MNILQVSDSVQQFAQLYTIQDKQEFGSFIAENPEVIALLLEAQKQIRKYFPQEKLTLNVSSGYEHTEWERIEVSIYVDVKNSDEAFDKLSQFDDEWWLNNCSGIGLKLYIGLEFE